jgi:hypothetical protein
MSGEVFCGRAGLRRPLLPFPGVVDGLRLVRPLSRSGGEKAAPT